MGFRLRKSINLFPGLKLNLSKKGLGLSAGVKGLRFNSRGDFNVGTGPITYQGRWKGAKKSSGNIGVVLVVLFIVWMLIH